MYVGVIAWAKKGVAAFSECLCRCGVAVVCDCVGVSGCE